MTDVPATPAPDAAQPAPDTAAEPAPAPAAAPAQVAEPAPPPAPAPSTPEPAPAAAVASPKPAGGARPGPLMQVVAFLGSYALACVLLLLLALLVFLGTIEQTEQGLFEVQRKYFDSAWLVHDLGGVPLPLPGVHLLLVLFAVNLLVGGLVRIDKSRRTLGVIVSHLGIGFLLLGGLVTFWFSDSGHLSLFEGREGRVFRSYHEPELALYQVGPDGVAPPDHEELLVREDVLRRAAGGPLTLSAQGLPFKLRLDGYWRNALPRRAGPSGAVGPAIDGWQLHRKDLEKEAELNWPGAYVTALGADGREQRAILWGIDAVFAPALPWVVEVGGERWAIELRRRVYDLPFRVHLDRFTHEYYPGTRTPRVYMSDVTMTEDGASRSLRISMNEPLRHRGYTLFQASFGEAGQGQEWSTFAVVRNPADHWPLYACIVISLGLLLHFGQKLARYVRAQTARREGA